MTNVGQRVQLIEWPEELAGRLRWGSKGTIVSSHPRYILVQWDDLTRPIAMRPEEIVLTAEVE